MLFQQLSSSGWHHTVHILHAIKVELESPAVSVMCVMDVMLCDLRHLGVVCNPGFSSFFDDLASRHAYSGTTSMAPAAGSASQSPAIKRRRTPPGAYKANWQSRDNVALLKPTQISKLKGR